MTFMIERLVPVYSVDHGDHTTWRKVRTAKGDRPLEWATKREAESFADLFVVGGQKSDMRVVEVHDA